MNVTATGADARSYGFSLPMLTIRKLIGVGLLFIALALPATAQPITQVDVVYVESGDTQRDTESYSAAANLVIELNDGSADTHYNLVIVSGLADLEYHTATTTSDDVWTTAHGFYGLQSAPAFTGEIQTKDEGLVDEYEFTATDVDGTFYCGTTTLYDSGSGHAGTIYFSDVGDYLSDYYNDYYDDWWETLLYIWDSDMWLDWERDWFEEWYGGTY